MSLFCCVFYKEELKPNCILDPQINRLEGKLVLYLSFLLFFVIASLLFRYWRVYREGRPWTRCTCYYYISLPTLHIHCGNIYIQVMPHLLFVVELKVFPSYTATVCQVMSVVILAKFIFCILKWL